MCSLVSQLDTELWPLAIEILGQVVIHLEVNDEELAPLSTPARSWRIEREWLP